MENSKISWCDHTFNPWVGCEPVSEACANCYAASMSKRWGQDFSTRRLTRTWGQPLKWQREAAEQGRRYRVFCGSMCDVFDSVDPDWHNSLWRLIDETPNLDWFLLTKRPENIPARHWPANTWLGITAENEERLAERKRALWDSLTRENDATPLFVSVEPMLGPIHSDNLVHFDWVILGCEKIGQRPGRPMAEAWLREVAENRDGPTFVKQMEVGGLVSGDPATFPSWAQRREFPV